MGLWPQLRGHWAEYSCWANHESNAQSKLVTRLAGDYDSNDNRIDFETRLHETAPFGVVSSTMRFPYHFVAPGTKREREVKMVLTLSKTGTGAQTELPDSN